MVRLEPAQIAELKAEALRRATDRGSLQPDASEIVREALAPWCVKRRRQGPNAYRCLLNSSRSMLIARHSLRM
jgi:hypothetical protein